MPSDNCRLRAGWHGGQPAEWRVSAGLVPYAEAVAFMQARVAAIAAGEAPELVWLLEHPPLYTAGTSARSSDLLEPRFPVVKSGRGGQLTYHGPGQRVIYVMLDLNRRTPDLRAFVCGLEGWIIAALARLGVEARRRKGLIGVWVPRPEKPHGPALNVMPDLSHYSGIVPCGISASHLGITSLRELGVKASMGEVDEALRRTFECIF